MVTAEILIFNWILSHWVNLLPHEFLKYIFLCLLYISRRENQLSLESSVSNSPQFSNCEIVKSSS